MALANLQAALARLSTDPAARALLVGDPQAFAEQESLTAEELADLRQTAERSLHVFSHSLLHKRAHEAGRAIERVREALGDRYGQTFEAYAATTPVARDPAHDALAFLDWLAQRGDTPPALRQLARYERAWVLMRRTGRRLLAGRFALPNGDGAPRRVFALWWRPRAAAPVRYLQWPRG